MPYSVSARNVHDASTRQTGCSVVQRLKTQHDVGLNQSGIAGFLSRTEMIWTAHENKAMSTTSFSLSHCIENAP